MSEPTYIAQNGDLTDRASLHAWFRERVAEAHERDGCDHFRYSLHPEIPNLALVEGWAGKPEGWDYGEPRWQFAAGKAA